MIDLLQMTMQFQSVNDRETERAYFRTNLPWIGPLAYFNIIYKPAPVEILEYGKETLGLPEPITQFLTRQNGAMLFSGALNIYGVVAPHQLLNRADPLSLPPFDLIAENQTWLLSEAERFIAIGSYGFDGTRVCVDRLSSKIYLFDIYESELRQRGEAMWPGVDTWLSTEIRRLSSIFDLTGRPLTSESATAPRSSKAN